MTDVPTEAGEPQRWRTEPGYFKRTRHLYPRDNLNRVLELDPTSLVDVDTQLAAEISSLQRTFDLPEAERIALEEQVGQLEQLAPALADLWSSLAPAFIPASGPSAFIPNRAVGTVLLSDSTLARVIGPGEVVIAAQYHAIHAGDYGPLLPTYRDITFETLIVDHRDGTLSRYVDWNFVMAQLGIVGTQRPLIGLDVVIRDADTNADGAIDETDALHVVEPEPDNVAGEPPPAEPAPPQRGAFDRLLYWLERLIVRLRER